MKHTPKFLAVVLIVAAPTFAQNAPQSTPAAAAKPTMIGPYTFSGSLRLRGENWNWFDTPGYDDNSTFGGALLRFGVSRSQPKLDQQLELAVPALIGLPDNAIAPAPRGQLGLGASYRAANGGQDASIFPKQAFLRFKDVGSKGNSLRIGRFEYWDGSEVVPKNPTLAALKRDRINHRLLGNFGFSNVGRSFDGVQIMRNTTNANWNLMAMRPAEGVFQLNGLGEVNGVDVLNAAFTKPMKNAEARIFAIYYRDDRQAPQSVKVDNRPSPIRAADTQDIGVTTIGAHYISNIKTGSGDFELLAWGALQRGDWGNLQQRANAFALEAGYQPKSARWKPWLRAGYFRSSGDGDATDKTHGTFFTLLPTPRIYARTPFYNQMNNEDLFAELILRPSKKLTVRTDVHRLGLTNSNDLFYAGGGAFQDNSFGYAGRPSGGDKSLATLFDISLDYNLSPQSSLGFYFGHARGGGVIKNIYSGNSLNYAYLEWTQKF